MATTNSLLDQLQAKEHQLEAIREIILSEVAEGIPDVESNGLVRVNILVPANVRRAWKTEAAQKDTTITDMILNAMRDRPAKP
jgi:hypothetical protein